MFDEPFTNELNYYKNNKNIFLGEIANFVKVIYINEELIGYIVLNYAYHDDKHLTKNIQINPIVINPKYLNKGYAKLIIKDLIKNHKQLVGESDLISSSIDKNNTLSIKLFEALNFEKVGMSEDGLFYNYAIFQKKIKKQFKSA